MRKVLVVSLVIVLGIVVGCQKSAVVKKSAAVVDTMVTLKDTIKVDTTVKAVKAASVIPAPVTKSKAKSK